MMLLFSWVNMAESMMRTLKGKIFFKGVKSVECGMWNVECQ